MKKTPHIIYRINAQDAIIFVNEEWDEFAAANDASELASEKILGRSFWDFISDSTTENIYRFILRQVRAGKTLQFNFRCDAPESRRLLRMTVSPLENGVVQFETETISSEKRRPLRILQRNRRRGRNIIVICSWCGKIRVAKNKWLDIEEALDVLGLFEVEILPQLSHGICESCYQIMSEKIQK